MSWAKYAEMANMVQGHMRASRAKEATGDYAKALYHTEEALLIANRAAIQLHASGYEQPAIKYDRLVIELALQHEKLESKLEEEQQFDWNPKRRTKRPRRQTRR